LLERLSNVARNRHLVLIVAGEEIRIPADGRHVSGRRGARSGFTSRGLLTASVHNMSELARAHQIGANLIFLSPVFATRSHPGAPSLGTIRFATLARLSGPPVIALGGMTPKRFRRLAPLGAYGWAAIDALSGRET
jgi:thiamine-phosphate pyrophosphorylase